MVSILSKYQDASAGETVAERRCPDKSSGRELPSPGPERVENQVGEHQLFEVGGARLQSLGERLSTFLAGSVGTGARGMAEMKEAGAATIAQGEATCVVFGMLAEAIKHGGVDRVLPLGTIAREVLRLGG